MLDALVALFFATFAYEAYLAGRAGGSIDNYYHVAAIAVLLQVNVFHIAGLYKFESLRDLGYQFRRLAVAWSVIFFLLVTVAFLVKTSAPFSRGWTVIWFASGFCGLLMVRLALYAQIGRWRQLGRLA